MRYIKLKTFSEIAAADSRRGIFNFKNESVVSCEECPDAIFIGDSITEQWELQAYFHKSGKYILNRGICGDTSKYMLQRLEADALSLSPKKIFMMIGINDLNKSLDDLWWGEEGLSLKTIMQEYEQNVYEIATRCKKSKTDLLICSLLPVNFLCAAYDTDKIANGVISANRILQRVARDFGFSYIDYHSHFILKDGFKMQKELSVDGLHPNAKGYRIMSEIIQKFLV